MSTILAKKIYQNSQICFNNNVSTSINGDAINNTPRQCWLAMNQYCCGGDEQWQLEFQQPVSLINVLTGVWIELIGGAGFMIDGNVADVAAKLNACCGSNAVVTQNYGSGLPAYQAPVAKTYSVVRADDNTAAAFIDAELAYAIDGKGLNILPNTFVRSSYNSGATPPVSTYQFQAYNDPKPQRAPVYTAGATIPSSYQQDVITETARVFTSNTAPSLAGANVFNVSGVADGLSYNLRTGATTLSGAVTALQADPVIGALGTWAVAGSTLTLTSTSVDLATVVLGQIA